MNTIRALILYALFMAVVGMAATLYLPESGSFGFNTRAATALASGFGAALLASLWAALLARGIGWAHTAALLTGLAAAGVFGWRAWLSWSAVQGGASEKTYAATCITMMTGASLLLAGFLALKRRGPA